MSIARGDRASFAELFLEYAPRVKRFLMVGGASEPLAEELTQETFLNVWRKAALFDPARGTAAGWIFTVARNARIDTVRREPHPGALEAQPSSHASPPTPEDNLLSLERQRRLQLAFDKLSPAQAEILRLTFLRNEPLSHLAKELGLPLPTAKSHLRRGVAKLRKLLGETA